MSPYSGKLSKAAAEADFVSICMVIRTFVMI